MHYFVVLVLLFYSSISFAQDNSFSPSSKDLRVLAEKGDPAFQLEYGKKLLRSSHYSYQREGFEWVKKAAKAGNVHAQLLLAKLYKTGVGVGKNSRLAENWLKNASDGGNQKAIQILELKQCEMSSYFNVRGVHPQCLDRESFSELVVSKGGLVKKGIKGAGFADYGNTKFLLKSSLARAFFDGEGRVKGLNLSYRKDSSYSFEEVLNYWVSELGSYDQQSGVRELGEVGYSWFRGGSKFRLKWSKTHGTQGILIFKK